MANYSAIKAAVNGYIKANGRKEITGSILNAVLNATIDSLGRYFQFAGGAMPTDDPGTPDQNVCYLATEPGLYVHFGNIRIENEEVALLFWNGEWRKNSVLMGIREVYASVDNQVGTPSVDVSYSGGRLVLTFHNLKGDKGDVGDAAGFGTIGADITGGVGTPGVSVETSGGNTAKNLMFHFTNLRGEAGVTSVVATIDDTSGIPACQVTLVNGQLFLAFSGLKGLKGDTGVSADYPITIYNGLDSDATDQALAAYQGKVLNSKITQVQFKITCKEGSPIALNTTADNWRLTGTGLCASDNTARLRKYLVTAGNIIYLKLSADTAGVFQFQSSASVPSSGTNANLIGNPVSEAFEGFVRVPGGATHLIVSELKTNTTNRVSDTIPINLDDIGAEKLLVPSVTASGKIMPSGRWQSDANLRIKKYEVTAGRLMYMSLSKDSDVVYQWQNNVSIPSTAPNPYLVGLPVQNAVNGYVFVPAGVTYLMVVESTSNTSNVVKVTDKNTDIVNLLNTLTAGTKAVNEDDMVGLNDHVNGTRRGFYINKNLTYGTSSFWYMSDPFLVRKGQKVSITAQDTDTQAPFLVGVDSSVPITSTSDVRTFTRIVELSPGDHNVVATREWIATEDTYVIAQWGILDALLLGTPAIIPELAEMWGIINESGEDADQELPGYVRDERDRVYDIIVNRSLGDVHITAFNTDQHFDLDRMDNPTSTYNPKWVMQGVRAMKEICNLIPVDMVVLGGDVAGYGGGTSADDEGILKTINYLFEPLVGIDSVLVGIPGNHDAYQNSADVTAQSMYNVFAKRNQRHLYYHGNGTDNCDAYIDDTEHKIRSIFVDTYSRNTRTEDFREFLGDALESLPEGYMALVFSHNPLTNEFAGVVMAQKISDPTQEIDAFQNPTDCHEILNQYADRIIACICGHTHFDASAVSPAGILYIETTTAAPHTRNYTTDNIPNTSTLGTVTDTSFDFFVIDQNAQTIEAVRYGEGCNRKWLYKGENAGMMPGYPQTIVRD